MSLGVLLGLGAGGLGSLGMTDRSSSKLSISSPMLISKNTHELIVEARKLEHRYPHALKVEYRGS